MVPVCEFNRLLSISVLHIHEKIFLSLDYQSYKNCQYVCKSWKDLLTSQFFQIWSESVYCKDIRIELRQNVWLGNVNKIKKILSLFTVDLNVETLSAEIGSCKEYPLRLPPLLNPAANKGHKDVVKLLLDRGAEPNRRSYHGDTPLKCAASHGHKDVVEILLKRGANPCIADGSGRSPLHIAARNGREHIVKLLLDEAADPNAQDNEGHTSLHSAAFKGHKEVVQILIDRGAKPNMANHHGETPLYYARVWKHKEIAEILEGRRKKLPQPTQ